MTDLLSEMQHVDTIMNNYCVLLKLNSPEQARVLIASELFCPFLKALATTRQPILALLTTTKITRLIIAVWITYMTCDHIHIFLSPDAISWCCSPILQLHIDRHLYSWNLRCMGMDYVQDKCKCREKKVGADALQTLRDKIKLKLINMDRSQ